MKESNNWNQEYNGYGVVMPVNVVHFMLPLQNVGVSFSSQVHSCV